MENKLNCTSARGIPSKLELTSLVSLNASSTLKILSAVIFCSSALVNFNKPVLTPEALELFDISILSGRTLETVLPSGIPGPSTPPKS